MAKFLNLDTDDTPDQYTKIIFDSVVYMLRIRYNDRSGWQLSLYDYDLFDETATDNTEAKIFGETKVMPNQNVFKYANGYDGLPTGYLILSDTDYPDLYNYEYPTRYNLGSGKRFKFVYFTADEYEELISEET